MAVLAGLLACWAALFHYYGWGLVSDVGGECGDDGPACPTGTAPLIVLAFVCTFAAVFVLIAALALTTPKRLAIVLAAVGIGAAIFPGQSIERALTSDGRVPVAWTAPPDRPAGMAAVAMWQHGTTVVRIRPDQATGYDTAKPATAWTFTLPGTDVVCSASPRPDAGVGLLLHGPSDAACATVTALDLGTGRALWTYRIGEPDRALTNALIKGNDKQSGKVAAAGGVAVVVEHEKLQGLDARTGAPLWQAATGENQYAVDVDADAREVVVATLGGTVRSLSPADGTERWAAKLPRPDKATSVAIIGTGPVAVWHQGQQPRSNPAVTAFDGSGKAQADIPVTGADEDLVIGRWDRFGAQLPRLSAVVGGIMVTAAKAAGTDEYRVSGYSLADGRRVWSQDVDRTVVGLRAEAGGVLVATDASYGSSPRMRTFEPGTGKVLRDDQMREVHGKSPVDSKYAVAPVGPGRYAVVNETSTPTTRPLVLIG
ncbi:outer membrane protein assembly factor BamB family protein [Yinghuangia soli]|uniref:PQQ-like beta-propeller repeat protein n=1 Tax=Yinghuangia soli TaxID=2908204 RepID=A0AA41U2E2_9ACTN|nr:PQQ-binding-like beta-propeller repeat protein [Yinghuangia soli]MCF2531703.1 PQQ-like beta-propeller repeat protein [Yinghuangia soli]